MSNSQIFIIISIAVLAVIAFLIFVVRNDEKRNHLTPLASIAFGFVLAGMLLGDNRLTSYSLMGAGVLLAIIDIFRRTKKDMIR